MVRRYLVQPVVRVTVWIVFLSSILLAANQSGARNWKDWDAWIFSIKETYMASDLAFLNECKRRTDVNTIWGFKGPEYGFLSNFYPAPVFGYLTSEHAYQAAKTVSKIERQQIRECKTPAQAKKLGNTVVLRPEWKDDVFRIDVMLTMVREKFNKHPELAAKLLTTGLRQLVEGNAWHDNFYGDCCCPKCADKPGQNHLGKVLMQVREELRARLQQVAS
jgi:ribA/ribD-fused uncharacterized protein